MRSAHVTALAVLMALFVALYPVRGTMEACAYGVNPYDAQSSSVDGTACVGGVLGISSVVVLVLFASYGLRLATADRRPAQFYLSPDPPPPRPLPRAGRSLLGLPAPARMGRA